MAVKVLNTNVWSVDNTVTSMSVGLFHLYNHISLFQHCKNSPRSEIVIELFTPVVRRILKHSIVSHVLYILRVGPVKNVLCSTSSLNCCIVFKQTASLYSLELNRLFY